MASRRITLASRFGHLFPTEGAPVVWIGVGAMLVGWGGAAIGMTLLRRPPAAGPLVGIALMVFCAGLAVAGPGIWMKFALEPWRRSAADGNGSKILVLVFRTWACGWFGFLGLALFAFRALLSVGVIVR